MAIFKSSAKSPKRRAADSSRPDIAKQLEQRLGGKQNMERATGTAMLGGLVVGAVLYGWAVLGPALEKFDPATRSMLVVCCQPCAPLALLLLWRLETGDPGRVRSMEHRGPDATPCKVCGELRPPRSHHCRTCGECVAGFDHHCGFLGVCIAHNNRLSFIVLVAVGAVAALQVLWATLVCASWELHAGCGGEGGDCRWFHPRLFLRYGVAILFFWHMALACVVFAGFQVVMLALGHTTHSWTQKDRPSIAGPALRECWTYLGRLLWRCLPTRCLLTTQGTLRALHEVGEGRVAKRLLGRWWGEDEQTGRYVILVGAATAISVTNASLLGSTPGGPGPAEAVYMLGTLALAFGCARTVKTVTYSHSRVLGLLLFRGVPAGEGPAGTSIGAHDAGTDRDESDVLLCEDGAAAPERWCEFCRARWEPLIHHCHKCGVCVPRRDHHCSLLGVCVGSHNRRPYIWLLIFGSVGSALTARIGWIRLRLSLPPLLSELNSRTVPLITESALAADYCSTLLRPLMKELLILGYSLFFFLFSWACVAFLGQQVSYSVYAEQMGGQGLRDHLFRTIGDSGWGAHRSASRPSTADA